MNDPQLLPPDEFKRLLFAKLQAHTRNFGWTGIREAKIGSYDSGVAIVPPDEREAKGRFYARDEGSGDLFQVANTDSAVPFDNDLAYDMPVRIGRPPKGAGLAIMGVSQRAFEFYGGALPSQYLDFVNSMVHPSRIVFLQLTIVSGFTIKVGAGWYRYGTEFYVLNGQNLGSLESYKPSTSGKAKFVLVCWSHDNQEMAVTESAEFDHASPLALPNALNGLTIPDPSSIVLGAVYLYQGQTALAESDLNTLQEFISVGTGGSGSISTTDATEYPAGGYLSPTSSLDIDSENSNTQTNAVGKVYYIPKVGSTLAYYDSGSFSIASIPVGLNVTIASAGVYDIFAYWTGTALALEAVAWTSNTARATELAFHNKGLITKIGYTTHRYLGTVYAYDSSGNIKVEDKLDKRHVFNMFNRRRAKFAISTVSSSWSLADNAITDWASISDPMNFVLGIKDQTVVIEAVGVYAYAGSDTGRAYILAELNGSDLTSVGTYENLQLTPASFIAGSAANLKTATMRLSYHSVGLNALVLREYFNSTIGTPGTDSVTSYGTYTDGLVTLRAGLVGYVEL